VRDEHRGIPRSAGRTHCSGPRRGAEDRGLREEEEGKKTNTVVFWGKGVRPATVTSKLTIK
jgi:hypothetical protein